MDAFLHGDQKRTGKKYEKNPHEIILWQRFRTPVISKKKDAGKMTQRSGGSLSKGISGIKKR